MQLRFEKYHGLGNDYLVIDPRDAPDGLSADAIRLICDRHRGVGSDGILYGPILSDGPPQVRIFNPDASEAEKSGNGLRIFAKYLHDKQYVTTPDFEIQTLGGTVAVQILDTAANLVRIDMGKATFISTEIPVAGDRRDIVDEPLEIDGVHYNITCLSIGNPHCVIPTDNLTEDHAKSLGPRIESHPLFPNRINMQLLAVTDRANIEIRIFERGVGYTLASGSSSCAAAAAAHRLGLVDSIINVKMPGGTLLIEIDDQHRIHMTGPVRGICQGTLHHDLEKRI